MKVIIIFVIIKKQQLQIRKCNIVIQSLLKNDEKNTSNTLLSNTGNNKL